MMTLIVKRRRKKRSTTGLKKEKVYEKERNIFVKYIDERSIVIKFIIITKRGRNKIEKKIKIK